MIDITEQEVFNELAEAYKDKKKESMVNILLCGKILSDAKEKMPRGMFGTFLGDLRVLESERTAQRLISVYHSFGHLLEDGKLDVLQQLGVTHLLALQKLPERFKKEIEIKEKKVSIIDEDKLSEFLEQPVEYDGKTKSVRDLPLDEMKKYIDEARGVYMPTTNQYFEDGVEGSKTKGPPVPHGFKEDDGEDIEEPKKVNIFQSFRMTLSDITILSNKAVKDIQNFTDIDIEELHVDEKKDIKKEIEKVKSMIEGLIINCLEFKDRLN